MRSSASCEGWVAALAERWGVVDPAATASGQRLPVLDVLINCAAGNFLATAEELSQNGFKTGAACAILDVPQV